MYIYQGTADPGSSLTVEQRKSKKMTKSFFDFFFWNNLLWELALSGFSDD
jgi:hypothetical protein